MKLDDVSVERINRLHPKIRCAALAAYTEVCKALTGRAMCRIMEPIRTFDEQAKLYAQGRTVLYDKQGRKLGKVTNAKPGQTYHNYGLAFDIALVKDTNGDGTFDTASWEDAVDFDGDGKADWMEAVAIFKRHGFAWGGDWTSFKDKPHFEMTFGQSWASLLAKHNSSKHDEDGFVLV